MWTRKGGLVTEIRRCAVVLDSRNVIGQIKRVLGDNRKPYKAGVIQALKPYGFDVVELHVGIATQSLGGSMSSRLTRYVTDNQTYAQRWVADGVPVLRGTLAERGGVVEEKQVDVLLAVKICELAIRAAGSTSFDCIVVLSEDMDLMPAMQFAESLGVKCYAAAADKVFERSDQRHWVALSEHSLRDLAMVPSTGNAGWQRRKFMANMAVCAPSVTHIWTGMPWLQKGSDKEFTSNREVPGRWNVPGAVNPKKKCTLAAVGVEPRNGKRDGVVFRLDSAPGAAGQPMPGVERMEIQAWVTPTRIKVSGVTGTGTLAVPPSPAPVGSEVVVVRHHGTLHYIGPVQPLPAGVSDDPVVVVIVTPGVAGAPGATWHEVEDLITGARYAVSVALCNHAQEGDSLRVFPVGASSPLGLPVAMPLTCC